ncbi:V-type ATPase subunit, partial [Candidatus Micrarchaeota archaeon]|nr:V-type ATPase subunit [Candidatus Micrarchaeota archaeon]
MTRPSSFSKIKRRPMKKQVVKPAGAQLKLPFSVQFPEFKPAKYGYVNARTKAMKGLLLDKEFLLEMCRMRTVPEVVEMLERTHYKSELVSNSMHYHGSDLVQIASMLYFAGMIEKLGGMIPESDKKAFNLVLMKWDISNLKAVLNGRRYGEKYPDIAPFLVPVGSLKEEELSAILEGSGEAAFSAFIRSEIGRKLIENKLGSSAEIEKMFRGDLTSEGTMRIETALDALLYNGYVNMENELGAEFEPIVRVVRKEVDLKNALIVARLKKNGIDDARK